ncbi:hypothetical protein CDD81_4853 [Ophiocordyceps australis]|uniref:Uncharacterized protein n=1 Tax=Ophiocordyceps australis TaxID=1399860 RepID=A0A2C5XAA5_9HYPO|nr:hypothetical protein CDD81_4853 [Ophiocordyceps australis]
MHAYGQSVEVSGTVTLDVKVPSIIHMSRPSSTANTTIQIFEKPKTGSPDAGIKEKKKGLAIFSSLRRHGHARGEPIRGLNISAPTMSQTFAMPSTDPRTGLSRPSSQCSVEMMRAMEAHNFFTVEREEDVSDDDDPVWS